MQPDEMPVPQRVRPTVPSAFPRLNSGPFADERQQPECTGDVAEEVAAAVGVDGTVAANHGGAACDGALYIHCRKEKSIPKIRRSGTE